MKKRVRATFLLQLVILLASAGLFAPVFLLASTTVASGVLVFLIAFWFVAIEGGLLPLAIERLVTRRVERRQGPVDSLWFVDVEEEQRRRAEADRRERERVRDAIRDNPSLQ